jgi:regulator of replication initiation timing
MKKLLAEIKFQTGYYYRNVKGYVDNVISAFIGRTGKQAKFLEEMFETTLATVARLSLENDRLKRKLEQLESKKVTKDPVSKKKASPKKGQ